MSAALAEKRAELAPLVEVAGARVRAQRVVDAIELDLAPVEAGMVVTLLAAFREEGRIVADAAEPLLDDPRYMVQEMRWRSALGQSQIQNLIDHILSASQLREWAGTKLTPKFWDHYNRVQDTIGKTLIRQGIATNLTQTTINRIIEHGGRRLGLVDIIGDARTALFRVIEQGVEAGLNPKQTARLIRDFIPEGRFVNAGSGYRAQLIARTETLHAQRMASLERYRTNRNIRQVMAFDGDGDEECAARNGNYYTLDDAEVEMSLEHPNGTLAFGPIGY